MRTEPINATGDENRILYYPDKVAYLRDFNAVTLKLNHPTLKIKSINVTFVAHYGNEQRSFVVNVDGDTATIDLSYFLRELGSGVTIDYISATGTAYYETGQPVTITFIRSESFITSNGYSLPNRQHYTETSVYTPPMSIYKKIHPNAERPAVEFGNTSTIIVNGERIEAGEGFAIEAPEEDCRIDVEVDAVGGYESWRQSSATWTYGATHFWADHVYIDPKSKIGSFITSQLPYFPQTGRFTNDEDRYQYLEPYFYTVGCFFRIEPNTPNVYKILLFTVLNTLDSNAYLITPNEDLFIHTDEYDDFMIIDYNDVRGYKRPTYGIYDEDGRFIQNMDFIFYNDVTGNGHTYDAMGHLVIGLNSPLVVSVPSSQRMGWMLSSLGLTTSPLDYAQNVIPYDYTVADVDSEVGDKYSLRTLLFGAGTTFGCSGSAILRRLFNTTFSPYATLHKIGGTQSSFTWFPNRQQLVSFWNLPQYVPVYALWYFLNIDLESFSRMSLTAVTDSSTLEIYPKSVKMTDNSINTASTTRGVSIIRGKTISAEIPMTYAELEFVDKSKEVVPEDLDKLIRIDGQSVFLYPIPANNGGHLSSAIILRATVNFTDGTSNSVFFDFDGMQLNCNPSNPYSPSTDFPDLPATFYVYFNDGGNELLMFEQTHSWTDAHSSAFSSYLTFTIESTDDSAINMQYYLFPYNCSIPTTLTNDDILPKYALMPSLIGNVGKVFNPDGDDLGCGLIVGGCYISPWNVGRTTVINNVTYPNLPEDTGWFSLFGHENISYPIRKLGTPDTDIYHNYFEYFQSLYNGVEMFYYYDNFWKNSNRKLLTYNGDLSTVVPAPCQEPQSVVIDFSKGSVFSYNLILYSLCDTDQVFWLRYENMDGFERWLPFEIKRRVYENAMGDFKYVTPTQSSINAYPMQSPLSLQEKITCFIGDVPQDCYIEDILYSPYLEGWNWDGSVHFQCVLEENEIVRDSSQELEDFVFNFIKKK